MIASDKRQKISAGTTFEYRVARLRFWQGFFVRRSIDVWPTGLEGDKLAELDCYNVSFDPQLRRFTEIVECKTGSGGQGEIDRLLWLRGIGEFAKAKSVTFAKLEVAPRTREFARQIGVDVLDGRSIDTAERDLGLQTNWWLGFHDPEFGEIVVKPARMELTGSRELRRAGKYLYGLFWFTDDFTRIKQLRSFFQLLLENKKSLSDPAFLLGLGEGITLLTLTTLSIASWKSQMAEADFQQLVTDELSTGLGDRRSLRLLLRRIDEMQRAQIDALHASYEALGSGRVPFTVKGLEQEVLQPPEWVDAFIDLVSRFAKRPHYATNILRWTDLWSARLLGAVVEPEAIEHLFYRQEPHLESALELTLAFLTRMWAIPADLLPGPKFQ